MHLRSAGKDKHFPSCRNYFTVIVAVQLVLFQAAPVVQIVFLCFLRSYSNGPDSMYVHVLQENCESFTPVGDWKVLEIFSISVIPVSEWILIG